MIKKILQFLQYKIDKSFQKNILNLVLFLILVSFIGIISFAAIIFILYKLNLITDVNFFNNLIWNTFKLFFDQNKILDIEFDKNSFVELFFKFSVTLFGIFIFSTLIAIITSYVFEKVMDLRLGRSDIKDTNHFIIFNYTNKTIPLIQEIIEGYQDKSKTIVIVDNSEGEHMLDTIKRTIKIPKNISVVARKGYGWQSSIVQKVNLSEAEKIIILSPDLGNDFKTFKEADTEVAKTLTAIRASTEWRKNYIPIISEFHSQEMSALYDNYATPFHDEQLSKYTNNSSNLTLTNIQSKLIAQCVNTPDASEIYDQLLGFKGSELYFVDEKDDDYEAIVQQAVGKNIRELNILCKKIIILGFYYTFNPKDEDAYPTYFLNPSSDFLFYHGCGLICLAENKQSITKEFQAFNQQHIDTNPKVNPIATKDSLRTLKIALINLSEDDNLNQVLETILDFRDIYNNQIEDITLFHNSEKKIPIKDLLLSLMKDRENRSSGYNYYFRYKNNNYHQSDSYNYSYLGLELVPTTIAFGKIKDQSFEEFTVKRVHPQSAVFGKLHPGDQLVGLSSQAVDLANAHQAFFNFDPKMIRRGLLKLLKDQVIRMVEEKQNFYFIVRRATDQKIDIIIISSEEIINHSNHLHASLQSEYEARVRHAETFLDKIKVAKVEDEKIFYSIDSYLYRDFNCKILLDHQREKFRFFRENPIEDHSIINHYIKYSTLDPSDTREDLSLITEVNGFRTKKLLDKYKKSFVSNLNGNDVIELNTLLSKYIGSVMMNQKSDDIIRLLLEEKINFIKTHLVNEPISLSFTNLEHIMHQQQETLIGIIRYDNSDLGVHMLNWNLEEEGKEEHTMGRKLQEVIINPEQEQVFTLNKGDKLITIANYHTYDQLNDANTFLI